MTPTIIFNMNKPALFLALKIGCAIEALLCGLSVVSLFSGGFGPCGPVGDFPGVILWVHAPANWVAQSLFPHDPLPDLFIILAGTVLWLSALTYAVIMFVKSLEPRATR